MTDISSKDLANYFEQSFNNPDVQRFLNASDSVDTAATRFCQVGEYISLYATSSGDLSQEAVSKIACALEQNPPRVYDERAKETYLREVLVPMIAQVHCENLHIDTPKTLEDYARLFHSVYAQSQSNRFETHSFNGALLDEIKTNGLNISKERFQSEFKILEEIGLHQPFGTGCLSFCELSFATFQYALRAPERIISSLHSDCKQKATETTRDFYLQSLKTHIKNARGTDRQKRAAFIAGRKIINFYFRPKGNKSAIAIRKHAPMKEYYYGSQECFLNDFLYKHLSLMENNMRTFCERNNDQEALQLFQDACKAFENENNPNKLDSFVKKFNKKYPDNNPLSNECKVFADVTLRHNCCINDRDENSIDQTTYSSGCLPPDDFAIAVLANPIESYVKKQRENSCIRNIGTRQTPLDKMVPQPEK